MALVTARRVLAQSRRKLALAMLDQRARRTRELIEMGGLVEKARLVEAIGLRDGDMDVEALLGVLLEAAERVRVDSSLVTAWRARGRKAFEADKEKRKGAGRPRSTGAAS